MNKKENSEAGRAGQFKKGDDPRRHKGGRKSREAIELSTALLNALTDEGKKRDNFKKLAEKIWNRAIAGQPWAVDVILDRFLGKATQSIEHSGQIDHAVFIMPRPKKKDADTDK